jgi:hypothetical protein
LGLLLLLLLAGQGYASQSQLLMLRLVPRVML